MRHADNHDVLRNAEGDSGCCPTIFKTMENPESSQFLVPDPESQRKWKAKSFPPKLLALFVVIMALSGFGLGIRGLPWWVQLTFGVVTTLCLASLLMVTITDPGVIKPKQMIDPLLPELLGTGETIYTDDGYCYSKSDGGKMEFYRWHISDAEHKWKYCVTCNIWRPPRAHHCSTCGYCMERFDHHCSVVATCIAKNNHRFFVSFLIFAQMGCLSMSAGSIWRLSRMGFPKVEAWKNPETYIVLLLVVIYTYIACMLLFGVLHCMGIIFDVTTKDILTNDSIKQQPPCCSKHRSLWQLIKTNISVWCGPIQLHPNYPGPVQAINQNYTP